MSVAVAVAQKRDVARCATRLNATRVTLLLSRHSARFGYDSIKVSASCLSDAPSSGPSLVFSPLNQITIPLICHGRPSRTPQGKATYESNNSILNLRLALVIEPCVAQTITDDATSQDGDLGPAHQATNGHWAAADERHGNVCGWYDHGSGLSQLEGNMEADLGVGGKA